MKSGRSLPLALRIVAFVAIPFALLWFLFNALENADKVQSRSSLLNQMRQILHRIAVQGNPNRRYDELLTRLCSRHLSVKSMSLKAWALTQRERGALDIFVFDSAGRLVPPPGSPPLPKSASERFLKGIREGRCRKPRIKPNLVPDRSAQ